MAFYDDGYEVVTVDIVETDNLKARDASACKYSQWPFMTMAMTLLLMVIVIVISVLGTELSMMQLPSVGSMGKLPILSPLATILGRISG